MIIICGAGAILRTVTAAIPRPFDSKMAHILVSAQWLRTQCGRAPENWRFECKYECECPPTLETECPLANQTPTTGQTLAAKVTPSLCPCPYLSKSAGLPEAQTTSGART
jgi:hypothetical protein